MFVMVIHCRNPMHYVVKNLGYTLDTFLERDPQRDDTIRFTLLTGYIFPARYGKNHYMLRGVY